MGFPYHELIPEAILLDNPGINKEEFIQLLDQTTSYDCFINKKDSWNICNKHEIDIYHKGFHGLARILNIKNTEEFEKVNEEYTLEKNLKSDPHLMVETEKINNKWALKFKVRSQKKDVKQKPRRYSLKDMEELDTKTYNSIEKLLEKYPHFDPKFKFDWRQKEGFFHKTIGNNKTWKWFQKNGKYYLDTNFTFNLIPASFYMFVDSNGDFNLANIEHLGYTDLILTAEAINHKAWKLFSRVGLKLHLEQFLKDFPDSKKRYDRAVLDAHTSLYAKKEKMTHFDLLRMRILGKQTLSDGSPRYTYPPSY